MEMEVKEMQKANNIPGDPRDVVYPKMKSSGCL